MYMRFDTGTGAKKNWILSEDITEKGHPSKYNKLETVCCQGNGYMTVRGVAEEKASKFPGRWTIVAGTFNLLSSDLCNGLVNSPDFTKMEITFGDTVMDAKECDPASYARSLDLETGLLTRSFRQGGCSFAFERVVSLRDKHVCAMRAKITPDTDTVITLRTGIDGEEGDYTVHMATVSAGIDDDGTMTVVTRTSESQILFATSAVLRTSIEPETVSDEIAFKQAIRTCTFRVSAGETLTVEKYAVIYTNRDRERDGCSAFCLTDTSEAAVLAAAETGFDRIASESADEWRRKIWDERDVHIEGCDRDQFAIRFAIYHLTCMTPVHDSRMNIGAKGLSGPGYHGHTFWDTEIYMLPYFIFMAPEEARSLVEYRYRCLPAAREYARAAGCRGARYPWEASWITDGESTPICCNTGDLERHITSDVAYGAYCYYVVTGDERFMEKMGYELIFECAEYWASAVEYVPEHDRYEILDVTGPDEYSEHVNNNAYTNYFARYTLELAVKFAKDLKEKKPSLYAKLCRRLGIGGSLPVWEERAAKLYVPVENGDGIIPQDDTYLSQTDVTRGVRITDDPEALQRAKDLGYNNVMVSKQADLVAVLYLLEDLFTPACKKKNFYFYEARCLHSSSLSLSTFSALATDMHEDEMAYSLFSAASMIDLSEHVDSSEGIHAASLGGIWQCCVFGFGGVRRYGTELRIEPNLPKAWSDLRFRIHWHGQTLELHETHDTLSVRNLTGSEEVTVLSHGTRYPVGDGLTIDLKEANA